jgi:hypothetical protein
MNQTGGSAATGAQATVPVATPARQEPARTTRPDRLPALVWLAAVVFVAVELAVSGRYGFMQDELYFIDAGRHLAFGYVDQPPLMPLLDHLAGVYGQNPTAIRIIPALAGGAIVVVAGRLAALFGAGRFGQALAAIAMACAPVMIGAMHLANTTPLELLSWAVVLLCVATAILRHRPAWWLGAGAAAGIGLEDNYQIVLLLIALAAGLAASAHRPVLRTRWPWLGAGIAAVIWAPSLIWQAVNGWPQLAMSSALHQQNSGAADYLGGLPVQLFYLGLLVTPLVVAGFIRLWRKPELRFIAIAAIGVIGYVLAWVPGKAYYADGIAPAVLAAGSVSAERWASRAAARPQLRRAILVAAPLAGMALILPVSLPLVPVIDVHDLPASSQQNSVVGDTIGFPQLARAVAAQDMALVRAGEPPTSIFTGYYAESAALDVLGSGYHLPPVLSGHNAYWTWGPGSASDRTVLVVDALGMVKPYFAHCRLLTTYQAPYRIRNDWTDIGIGVCTGPAGGWATLWPHLKHYG